MSNTLFNSAHIADLHFAAFNPKEQYEILKSQFIEVIKDIPLDLISVNGDIFDHKLMGNSDSIYYASLFIDELVSLSRIKQCTLILLHGTYSHDADQLKLFYHYMNDDTVDVRVITTIQFEQIKNMRLLCIPELYGIPEETYQYYLHHSGWYDEAIIHGTFKGSVYNDNVKNGRLFVPYDFNMCTGFMVGGHVHKPGCFSGYFYYCGCPYRWKFGEEEDKGFLICTHDLEKNTHFVHFQKIISHTYITIDFDQLFSEDAQKMIQYIDDLKKSKGIDYLKVRFNIPINGAERSIINNYYRNSHTTFVEFLSIVEEQKLKEEGEVINDTEYGFMFDDRLSPEEKFVQYVNLKEGCQMISVEKLKQILSEQL